MRKPTYQYTIDYSFIYEKDNEEGRINLSQSCKYWYDKMGEKLLGKSQIGSGSKTQCSRHFPLLTENDSVFYTISSPGMIRKIQNNGGYIVLRDTGSKTYAGISFYAEPDENDKHKRQAYIRLTTTHYNLFFDRDNFDKDSSDYAKRLDNFSQLKGATFIRVEARLREGVFEAPDWADTNTNKK